MNQCNETLKSTGAGATCVLRVVRTPRDINPDTNFMRKPTRYTLQEQLDHYIYIYLLLSLMYLYYMTTYMYVVTKLRHVDMCHELRIRNTKPLHVPQLKRYADCSGTRICTYDYTYYPNYLLPKLFFDFNFA